MSRKTKKKTRKKPEAEKFTALHSPYKNIRGKKVKISRLVPFDKHPFDVPADESPEMQKLISSIKAEGLLNLPIVRKMPTVSTEASSIQSTAPQTTTEKAVTQDEENAVNEANTLNQGSGENTKETGEELYQIVCGHRRIQACKALGLEEIPVSIVEFADDDDATLTMISSNIQREKIDFPEKVRACALMYETKKHQGKSKGEKSTRDYVGKIWNTSSTSIQRFVELSKLSDSLLELIGKKRLTSVVGIEIAKMSEDMKNLIADVFWENKDLKLTLTKAKEILDKGNMTKDELLALLQRDATPTEQQAASHNSHNSHNFAINFSSDEIQKLFPEVENLTEERIKELILERLGV